MTNTQAPQTADANPQESKAATAILNRIAYEEGLDRPIVEIENEDPKDNVTIMLSDMPTAEVFHGQLMGIMANAQRNPITSMTVDGRALHPAEGDGNS